MAVTDTTARLVIEGGPKLYGPLPVGGAKNAVQPMLAAAILAPGQTTLTNVSVLEDVWTFAELLSALGCSIIFAPDQDARTPETLDVDATHVINYEPPADKVRAIRASFYLAGALLARLGKAKVALPGGDAWGPRPVNLHLEGMKAFGAEVDVSEGFAYIKAPSGGLPGGSFKLEPSSVGATVNLLLAASTARGTCRIENAAREPDVVACGHMLQTMGARIQGLGSKTIEIEGVRQLEPTRFRTIPDRIEVGTYMIAAAMAGTPGEAIHILGADTDHLGDAFLSAFRQTGAKLLLGSGWIEVTPPKEIRPVTITTAPYPGFPTDLQAQWTAMMTQATGPSAVHDPIYPDRLDHIAELQKMGANLKAELGHVQITPSKLKGAAVMTKDVRAGAALVLGGLVAEGVTSVSGLRHLDRGYERIEQKLAEAGARIRREEVDADALQEALADSESA